MQSDNKPQLRTDILASMRSLEYDVALRNVYMNKRDRYLYQRGLYETLNFPDGFDQTTYNFLPRVVDIHTAQLMGRLFSIQSWYEKEDLSLYDPQQQADALKAAELSNKEKKVQADARKRSVDAIIRDNGGAALFKRAARIGSAYGNTVFKMWWDADQKKIRISVLESPHNYRAGWSDSDFRERDWDAYVMEISEDKAYKQYGQYLEGDAVFEVTQEGFPLSQPIGNVNTSDPLDQNTASSYPVQTQRPMVAVIEFTGIQRGWGVENGQIVPVKRGQEKPFHALIVGGHIVQTLTDERLMPKYYLIRNREIPRRAWGESDLPDSALEINATYLERMSDFITIANKTLFPMVQAKGFESSSIPTKEQRKMKVVPMGNDQSLEVVQMPNAFGSEYMEILSELKDSFVRVTGIGRVLFDDPTMDMNSNPAISTMMKGVVDIVEDKQSRWEPVLCEMFEDALRKAAQFDKNIKAFVNTGDYWYFYIQWPNILRKEDPAFQAMLLNDLHTGAISIDSYMEQRGITDVTEEINRLRDALKDPIRAAIHGNRLSELAQFTIFDSLGVPLWGFNPPKISLKGDITPQQEGNMASLYGWNDGPFGASMGPQGLEGERANEDVINQGQSTLNPYIQKYGFPTGITPGQPINPNQPGAQGPASQMQQQPPQAPQPGAGGQPAPGMVTPPGMNIPQPVSQPGSGAPGASAEGRARQSKQHRGR